ncbi:MAG: hypothetical protein BroJett029_12720 [Alphaproteobacteria bacterium]|nr:MAG: hypothetical protein BroJett029_12720 [Alphaproteobacteria bacterium]
MDETGLIRLRSIAVTRRRLGIGAAALAGLATAGLHGRPARAAAHVAYLGWQGYDAPLLADDALQAAGITLDTAYIGRDDEILARLNTGGVGQIDIVTPDMGYIPALIAAGLIDPIDEPLVPNLARIMPLFRDQPAIHAGGRLYAVPFTWGSAPMLYDPAAHPMPPASWKDLLKPDYAGRIGMMDDPLGNTMLAALIVTDARSATLLTRAELEAAVDFLIEMKKQSRLVAGSWSELADALSRSDITVTFSGWEAIQKFCADKGKAVEHGYPAEGTFAWIDSYCVVRDAPNREAAHVLANQIIGVPAQISLAEQALQAIVNTEAIAALEPSLRVLYPYDDMESFGRKAQFFAFPPLDSDGRHATYAEWIAEYERFKNR